MFKTFVIPNQIKSTVFQEINRKLLILQLRSITGCKKSVVISFRATFKQIITDSRQLIKKYCDGTDRDSSTAVYCGLHVTALTSI